MYDIYSLMQFMLCHVLYNKFSKNLQHMLCNICSIACFIAYSAIYRICYIYIYIYMRETSVM